MICHVSSDPSIAEIREFTSSLNLSLLSDGLEAFEFNVRRRSNFRCAPPFRLDGTTSCG